MKSHFGTAPFFPAETKTEVRKMKDTVEEEDGDVSRIKNINSYIYGNILWDAEKVPAGELSLVLLLWQPPKGRQHWKVIKSESFS